MADEGKQANGKKYKFNLDRIRAPGVFRDRENLWQEDLQRIYRLVKRQVDILDERDQERGSGAAEKDIAPPHLSIAVFGPSGSGKSSLLRTLADDVRRKRDGIVWKAGLGDKVFSLDSMDPTTWSESEQFLYAFLAAALEAERDEQEKEGRKPRQGLSSVQLAFQEVNEYLRVVDDPGASGEHDPLGLSLQKLERHTSGLRLRKALDDFIEALAKELKAKVILLPVDDLDMAPHHLVSALQAYQSYLAHPRLVPVFTFTDRMPEELIEVHYERKLADGKGRRRLEETGSKRLTISEQLSVQFLARCFPVRNRIRLGPAPARVQRAVFEASSGGSGERKEEKKDELEVLELLTIASFLLFGHPDKEDAHQVKAALRPSTLRRQMQVVDAMSDCRLQAFRVPQLARMANPSLGLKDAEELNALVRAAGLDAGRKSWKLPAWPGRHRLAAQWLASNGLLDKEDYKKSYLIVAYRLKELGFGATWANVFNGAVWSLLNVHRDILRELGLFLEDLYSWTPKELRSFVLDQILTQDRVMRRTVLDRWFNRTDFRRSQVLSLLAANVFRPWMTGEEPYGDEETPLREQLRLEMQGKGLRQLDEDWKQDLQKSEGRQARERMTFASTEGLLWFINVTLGFYLPQIMARGWPEFHLPDMPVKGRMSGSGWDLLHAPINAMRVADAKQEAFSFGMIFLDPRGYRHALEAVACEIKHEKEKDKKKKQQRKLEKDAWEGAATPRGHLLLRIWSCCGYSRSRFWAAFSLWRGLGFMGQVLELGLRERARLGALCEKNPKEAEGEKAWNEMQEDLKRLIRSHCVSGMVPGSLLDRDSDEKRLLRGFPAWEPGAVIGPKGRPLEAEIGELANDLLKWLVVCWQDRIFPLPAGAIWVGWRDCFVRRIHGEYILGSLWPRLNSAYLEKRERDELFRQLARRRNYPTAQQALEEWPLDQSSSFRDEERFRWTAAVAAAAWSDILLDYWRRTPQVVKLLVTCPTFFKSLKRFDKTGSKLDGVLAQLTQSKTQDPQKGLHKSWLGQGWEKAPPAKDLKVPGLICEELAIERVRLEDFTSRPIERHSVTMEPLTVDKSKGGWNIEPAPENLGLKPQEEES